MKFITKPTFLLLAALAVGAAGYATWKHTSTRAARTQERSVLFYQDSMHPWIKSERPGKCTICAMDLTPIYAGDKGFDLTDDMVVLRSNSITVLNVQTETVRRQPLERILAVAGTLEGNETRKTIVSAPTPGRVQALAVEFAGVEVEEGQTLLTMFSPELVQKRSYLVAVGVDPKTAGNGLLHATSGTDPYSGNLIAPQSGVVVERNVYTGQYVAEGERLLTIVDASVMWFRFDVYQDQLAWFEVGQTIEVMVPGIPGKVFPAVVAFIDPTVEDATRTVKVRADIQNPIITNNGHAYRQLRFGMYAEGRVRAQIPDVLTVPRDAVLFPGGAAYAYVDKGDGAYERRRIRLGCQGDTCWQVIDGLEEGERVVTSGNVLIDAQTQFTRRSDFESPLPGGLTSAGSDDGATHAGMVAGHSTAPTDSLATPTAAAAPMSAEARKALTDFLATADGISRMLAADDLNELKQHAQALPAAASALVRGFGPEHPWQPLLLRIETAARWPASADLAAARKSFLPFSTETVELVQLLRGQENAFASLKVYHCPMAPNPGLWFQAKGPLRNPYYGAAMLTCGEEVRPLPPTAITTTDRKASGLIAHVALPAVPAGMPMKESSVADRTSPADRPAAPHGTSTPSSRNLSYIEADFARMGVRDNLQRQRWEAIAKAASSQPTDLSAPMPTTVLRAGNSDAAMGIPQPKGEITVYPGLAVTPEMAKLRAAFFANRGAAGAVGPKPTPPTMQLAAQDAPPPTQPPASPPGSGDGVQAYRAGDAARAAMRDQMRTNRTAAMTQGAGTNAADTVALNASQRQALQTFLAQAAKLSAALAADDLAAANKSATNLPAVLMPLQKAVGTNHPYSASVQRLATLSWKPSPDLARAREQFLPFSTTTVELVKRLRKEDPAFGTLKIYHCPMAPKPGLWMQDKGPLRNPFYGSKMLTCGEEVTG